MEDKRSSSSIASSTRTQMSKSQTDKSTSKPAPVKSSSRNLKILVLALALIIAIGTSLYFYNKYQQSQEQLKNPQSALQAQTQDLVDQVSKHTELPKGSPTVATVSDVSKLSTQTFFVNAKNGDKVLIYADSKKAILYRPSEDKIINIAPLNVNSNQPN